MTRLITLVSLLFATASQAELLWIWNSPSAKDKDKVSFRKTFTAPAGIKSAEFAYTCDNGAKATLNGAALTPNPDWMVPTKVDVSKQIKAGENTILIDATNQGSAAGLVVRLTMKTSDKDVVVETDTSWEASVTGKNEWKPAVSVGSYGKMPWGKALEGNGKAGKRSDPGFAIDPKDVTAPPGFKVEQLYVVPKDNQGSWVSMTVDKKGRLLCGDQYGAIYRLTPPPVGSSDKAQIEKLPVHIGGAHGLLYAFDSLYVMLNEKGAAEAKGMAPGLYRLKDSDGDDHFGEPVLLSECNGGGEHGPHSMQVSPDGKSIFFNCGNHTKLPTNLALSRAPMGSWDEDHILPRMWDANGHARGIMAPGGYICKTDPEGKVIELFCQGFRNEFDFAFDLNGEMFAYDADMEWDIGSPWYRPTRINHCVSGGDYGWRSGSGKWPAYYEDSLPACVDIGPGSPTGVTAGTGAKFPAKYQRAIFGNDWTYGTMYAIHTEPNGAGVKAVKEEFIFGKPLPLTDVVINQHDGAMYFGVGGRRTQSAVYRVTYEGKDSTEAVKPSAPSAELTTRREIEQFHEGAPNPAALAKAWPLLGSKDRNLRFAARIAIERLPVATWTDKALAETEPQSLIEAMIALARMGRSESHVAKPEEGKKAAAGSSTAAVGATNEVDAKLQARIVEALASLDFKALDLDLQLQLVRAYQLAYTRLGKPSAAACEGVAARIDAWYPAKDTSLNKELCQLLVFLDSKTVAAKTLSLMATAHDDDKAIASDELLDRNASYGRAATEAHESRPNRAQIAYVFALRNCRAGWTPELRKQYFSWFPTSSAWKGGNSFRGFINNARAEAMANFVPDNERAELEALSTKVTAPPVANYVAPKGPGKAYTLDEALAIAQSGLSKRNFDQGKAMFSSLMCITCHRFNGDGGSIGPDITGAANRYTMRDFLENIVDPSKVISDQYGSIQIEKNDGSVVIGRTAGEENGNVLVMTNPIQPNALTTVKGSDIKTKKEYPVSMMPPGLINALNKDELLDLIAYVMSGGDAKGKAFK